MDAKKLTHADVLAMLPDREPTAHKGDFGKILLLCGSVGFTGASAMAAMGALRTGAGLVYLGVPESIYAIEAMKLTEPIVFPLPSEDGMYSAASLRMIGNRLKNTGAVLLGPGIGKSAGTDAVVRFVLETFSGPVVLDADGINLVAKHKDILRDRTGTTIITPHEGEFSRLGGDVHIGRQSAAEAMAQELGVIVLLKGHETVITDGVHTYLNPTGNPGMAVGGSGDVLAGMIVSLLGQKIPALKAAAIGAWLHGAAGDVCAKQLGQYAMLPTDMLEVLPRLLK